jgi:hypothetical protein
VVSFLDFYCSAHLEFKFQVRGLSVLLGNRTSSHYATKSLHSNYSRATAPNVIVFRLLKDERLAIKDTFKGAEKRVALLARGGEIASQTTERPRSIRSSKAARDLLLQLNHPQVTFRTIIGTMKGVAASTAQPALPVSQMSPAGIISARSFISL